MILSLPEEVQPVPPQTSTWERNIAYSSLLVRCADGVLGDDVAVDKMLGHDARDLLRGHFYIGDLFLAGAGDLHHRLVLADADAARLGDDARRAGRALRPLR